MPTRKGKVIPINGDAAFREAIRASQEAMDERERAHHADYYERLPEYRARIEASKSKPVHTSVLRRAGR